MAVNVCLYSRRLLLDASMLCPTLLLVLNDDALPNWLTKAVVEGVVGDVCCFSNVQSFALCSRCQEAIRPPNGCGHYHSLHLSSCRYLFFCVHFVTIEAIAYVRPIYVFVCWMLHGRYLVCANDDAATTSVLAFDGEFSCRVSLRFFVCLIVNMLCVSPPRHIHTRTRTRSLPLPCRSTNISDSELFASPSANAFRRA